MSAGGYSGLASARELAAKTSPALRGLTSAGGPGTGTGSPGFGGGAGSPDRFTLHGQSPGSRGRQFGGDRADREEEEELEGSVGRSEAGSEYGDDSFAGSSVDGSGVEGANDGRGSSSAVPSSSSAEAGVASLRGSDAAAQAGEMAALSGSIGRQPSRVLGGGEAAGSSNRLPPPDGDGFEDEDDAFEDGPEDKYRDHDDGDDYEVGDEDDDALDAAGKFDRARGRASGDNRDGEYDEDEDEDEGDDDRPGAGDGQDQREPWDREGSEFEDDEDDEGWQDVHTEAGVSEWEVDDVVAFLSDDLSMGEQMMTHAQAAQLTGHQLMTMGEEELRTLLGADEQGADWLTLKAALRMIKEAKPAGDE